MRRLSLALAVIGIAIVLCLVAPVVWHWDNNPAPLSGGASAPRLSVPEIASSESSMDRATVADSRGSIESASRYLRFFGDGQPLPGVRLFQASKRRSLQLGGEPIGIADGNGTIACGVEKVQGIAFADGMVSEAVSLEENERHRDVHMVRAMRLTVWCLDDLAHPVRGCVVELSTAKVADAPLSPVARVEFDNPAVEGFDCRGVTDIDGRAEFYVPSAESLFVRLAHRYYFADSPQVVDHQAVDPKAGQLQLRLVPAWGLVARGPSGTTLSEWRWTVSPAGFDRRLHGLSEAMAFVLKEEFGTEGVYVLPRLDGSAKWSVAGSASDTDGALWWCDGTLQRLDMIQPVIARAAEGQSGWLCVELLASSKEIRGIPLMLIGEDGSDWSITSFQASQLPPGRYKLGPRESIPGIDEALIGVEATVSASRGRIVQTLSVSL